MSIVDQRNRPGAPVRRSLRREVGLAGLLWASLGSIIGSGWLYSAKNAVVVAGPAALVAWGIATVAIMLLAMVHAELGSMLPAAGGTARYPRYTFGGLAGMSFGWLAWVGAAAVVPIEVEAMIGYSAHWQWARAFLHPDQTLTATGFVVAVVLLAVFTVVNFLGIRLLAHTNSAATAWKVAIPLLTIFVLAVTHFHAGNFTSHGFAPFGAKGVLGAISTSGVIFALAGFEQAIQLSGEGRRPERDVPLAVVGSTLIGAVVYVLLQVVFIGAVPASSISRGWAQLAYTGISGPFAGLVTVLGLGWLAWVLYFDAIVSPGGSGLIYTTGSSRIAYALCRNGYAPKLFEKTNDRGVPWFSLIVSFTTGVVCFLPFPSWQQLVGFLTAGGVLMYASAPLAFGALRNRLPHRERPYRLPGGTVVAPLAFVIANLVIYWTGWNTLWRLGLVVIVGNLLLGGYSAYALAKQLPDAPPLDWKAAQWLPVYLAGMGVISWQGGFGQGAEGHLPLGWDIAVTAAFSLVIYYWAQAVALPAPDIERNIDGPVDAADHTSAR
jgi:amino acid transporter